METPRTSETAIVSVREEMSASCDGTRGEINENDQESMIFNQKPMRSKREKPVSFFIKCEM